MKSSEARAQGESSACNALPLAFKTQQRIYVSHFSLKITIKRKN